MIFKFGRLIMARAGFKVLAVASSAALLLVSGAGSANARTAQSANCLEKVDGGRSITGNPWVKVKNNCAWTYDVKVVWRYGPDSTCKALSPGKTRKSTSTPPASYQTTKIC
jgi:hypothetical protein